MKKERNSNWDDPAWRRKALYTGVVALAVILSGVGVIEPSGIDATVERILQIVGPLLGLFGLVARRNVDAPARQVEQARQEGAREQGVLRDYVQQATEEMRTYVDGVRLDIDQQVDRLPERIRGAVESIYRAPHGDHELREQEQIAAPETAEEQARREALAYYRQSGEG